FCDVIKSSVSPECQLRRPSYPGPDSTRRRQIGICRRPGNCLGPRFWERDMQSFAKAVLWVVGCLSFLVAIILALIVLDMFQHPRGVGMEWLAGPLVGFFGLTFITVGVVCIRVALALKKKSVPSAYRGGSEVVGR